MGIIVDDRTETERTTHRWLVVATDRFMSGWGHAQGGSSVAAWACSTLADAESVETWVRARPEMSDVRVVREARVGSYKPRSAAHFHLYVAREGHPGL